MFLDPTCNKILILHVIYGSREWQFRSISQPAFCILRDAESNEIALLVI